LQQRATRGGLHQTCSLQGVVTKRPGFLWGTLPGCRRPRPGSSHTDLAWGGASLLRRIGLRKRTGKRRLAQVARRRRPPMRASRTRTGLPFLAYGAFSSLARQQIRALRRRGKPGSHLPVCSRDGGCLDALFRGCYNPPVRRVRRPSYPPGSQRFCWRTRTCSGLPGGETTSQSVLLGEPLSERRSSVLEC
jgi:hypothetical protein